MQDSERKEFGLIMRRLYAVFAGPQFATPPQDFHVTLDEYWHKLNRFDLASIRTASEALKEQCKKFPTIREFMEQARIAAVATKANSPASGPVLPTQWDHRCPACLSESMSFGPKGTPPLPDITMAQCIDCGYKDTYTAYMKARPASSAHTQKEPTNQNDLTLED